VTATSNCVSRPMDENTRPIRILYIIDSLWGVGGAELCLARLVRHLPRAQFECRVLTFHSNEICRPFREQFDCPVDHWQLNNIRDRNAFRIAKRLRNLVREHQFDIVHTFFQTSDLWAGPIAKLCGVKVLISSRRDMGILRSPKHNVGYRIVRGMFDQVQAVSEEVRRYAIETDGLNPQKTITIHNGIDSAPHVSDCEIEELRQIAGLDADTPVVSCVANVRPVKGIDVLVRAAALVHREMPKVRFLVAGAFQGIPAELEYTAALRSLQQSLGVESVIRFLGQIKEVPALLKLSDIFVLPSRSEGLSNALLEAMRAGLPCVATSVGGNPEVVVNGVTGFLIPLDSPEALADRILKLLRDPALRRRMGQASRFRVLQNFTLDVMGARIVAQYNYLLQRKDCKVMAAPETVS
jgi:glycosyltransferase involved in cell wall biosynthesis